MNASPRRQGYRMLRAPVAICLVSLSFFSVWTVLANFATLFSLPFETLWAVLFFSTLASLWSTQAIDSVHLQVQSWSCKHPSAPPLELRQLRLSRNHYWRYTAIIALFCVGSAIFFLRQDFRPIWALVFGLSLAGLLFSPPKKPESFTAIFPKACEIEDTTPLHGDRKKLLFFFAALFIFYFFTSRPDIDDAFYLNLALNLPRVDHGMLQWDTMHGHNNWPLMMSTYRLESLPHLVATLSQLTRLPTIYVAHSLMPMFFVLTACAVLYVLYSRIFGQFWFVACFANLAFLFILDGSLQSYASHGIVRFIHGKGPLITFVVPLVTYLTYIGIRERSRLCWLMLFVVHICAMGLTANAIYVTPIAMGLVAFSMAIVQFPKPSQFAPLILSSAIYPISMALFLLLFDPPLPSEVLTSDSISASIWALFPTKILCLTFLGGFVLAASSTLIDQKLTGQKFRLASAYALSCVLFIFNPVLWDDLGTYVTGNLNYRLFWAIPLPMIAAMLFVSVWHLNPRRLRVVLGIILSLILLSTLMRATQTTNLRLGLSFKKVQSTDYEIAQFAHRTTAPGSTILAPERISAWVATMSHDRHPVIARPIYFHHFEKSVGAEILESRKLLHQWLTNLGEENNKSTILEPFRPEQISKALVELCVGTIIVPYTSDQALETAIYSLENSIFHLTFEIIDLRSLYHVIQVKHPRCSSPGTDER